MNLSLKVKVAPVYKIVLKKEWDRFIVSGKRECKGFGNDLKSGFIHLSTHGQLYDTYLKKFKKHGDKNLNLIAVDVNLSRDLRWELEPSGIVYPHLYSSLILNENVMWVIGLKSYQFSANGL
jgi:uncharacterized protein (DUF952 family)